MDLNFPRGSQSPEWPSDSWVDPEAERTLLRRQLRRSRFGFSMLGLALVVASLSNIGLLIQIFARQRVQLGVLFGVRNWDLMEGAVIVWGSLLGVALLCTRWPDESWWRRSGLLLMMGLADAALWMLEHAADLGLGDGKAGHEWFRHCLGEALGWSEFALIASLAGDMAARLGEPQAVALARAVRSLATTGAMVWFLYFYFRTDWKKIPIWPLAERPQDPNGFMLLLGWLVLAAILCVQSTALTLLAGRCCGRALREMAAEDRARDRPPSRSEAGWEELQGPSMGSGPKRRA